MTEDVLRVCIRDIGDNTHTAKLVKAGDWAGAMLYIKKHDLDHNASFEYKLAPASPRAEAYRRLVDYLEGKGNGH